MTHFIKFVTSNVNKKISAQNLNDSLKSVTFDSINNNYQLMFDYLTADTEHLTLHTMHFFTDPESSIIIDNICVSIDKCNVNVKPGKVILTLPKTVNVAPIVSIKRSIHETCNKIMIEFQSDCPKTDKSLNDAVIPLSNIDIASDTVCIDAEFVFCADGLGIFDAMHKFNTLTNRSLYIAIQQTNTGETIKEIHYNNVHIEILRQIYSIRKQFKITGKVTGVLQVKQMNKALLQVAIDTLNEAYAADPAAIHALICNHVPCNQQLADHPTILVDKSVVLEGAHYNVRMLGVINGIIERLTGSTIMLKWSENTDEEGRHTLLCFAERPD